MKTLQEERDLANDGWVQAAVNKISTDLSFMLLCQFTPELEGNICGRVRYHLEMLRRKMDPKPIESPEVEIVLVPPPEWHPDSDLRNPILMKTGYYAVKLSAHPVVVAQWKECGLSVEEKVAP